MNTIKRGEIYYCNKFYTENGNLVIGKPRPAIVVSTDIINSLDDRVTVVFLTSVPKFDHPCHITIKTSKLLSTALCETIFSVERAYIHNYAGKVSELEMKMIDEALKIGLEQNYSSPLTDTDISDEKYKEIEFLKQYIEELKSGSSSSTSNEDKMSNQNNIDIETFRYENDKLKAQIELLKEMYDNLLSKYKEE